MATVKIHHAKTHLSRLIEKACQGEEVIISRGEEPVVRLVPVKTKKSRRIPGTLKNILKIGPSFFEPLPSAELKAWE